MKIPLYSDLGRKLRTQAYEDRSLEDDPDPKFSWEVTVEYFQKQGWDIDVRVGIMESYYEIDDSQAPFFLLKFG